MMESQQLSLLSSLRGDPRPEDYIQPHYKEAYRVAIDSLVCGGKDSYQEFLKGERIGSFLSEDELVFITTNAQQPAAGMNNLTEDMDGSPDNKSSTGTYWPVHSDVETPDLELGWPEVMLDRLQTNIDLLFHPPRLNSPTIKEVIRKHIQDARQVIAIVMDVFTDVDIFKEAVEASVRGVPVYVLLDDFHLQSFLSMAENQGVHIQKLRNMRVRTVKGQEYLCRSGARFNGAMEQRFLLVDCQTVVYGSYSFMWSFEKIHLSMVQVIKGELVGSYDEEFRTLYARSTVPAVLCPSEGLSDSCRQSRGRGLGKYASQSGQTFERKDLLRHTLDTVYKKACERQMGMREMEDRPSEQQLTIGLPNPGLSVQSRIQQFQSLETANFLKRHSYAGERQEGPYIPSQNLRFGASNWNVAGDGGYHNGRIQYSNAVEDYQPQLQGNQLFRSHNMRQSYHGIDKQVVSMKQNMPTLERVSKSFFRTQRIESYLSNTDAPIGEASDYLDQYEPPSDSKAGSYIPSRVRSSIVFNSTIPEQPENNSYTNTSSSSMRQTDHSTVPNNGQYYSSMQWNPAGAMDSRARQEEFMLKRRSLLMLDDPRGNMGFGPYASLGRAKGGPSFRNPDILQDNWHKRHSVADPKSHIDYRDHRESSGHMYGGIARRQVERSTSGINAQNGGYGSNLKEDQRSASQYDVKNVTDTKSQSVSMWQEPPSRTVSAAALDVKSTNVNSPRFMKNGSKKLRSLLNIPEKKEVSPHSKPRGSPGIEGYSDRPPSELHMDRNHFADDLGKSSAPRFSTEELQQGTPDTALSLSPQKQQQHTRAQCNERTSLTSGNWRSRDRGSDHRLYSRFEPFCAFDKKPLSPSHTDSGSASTHTQVKPKNTLVTKDSSASEPHNHVGQPTQSHHENKLGKFIQRVGNFIHKNK